MVLELAAALRPSGVDCDFVCPQSLGLSFESPQTQEEIRTYSDTLGKHLQDHAGDYDVVDVDHCFLPFERRRFSPRPLLVARSVLLVHHLAKIRFPINKGLRARIGHLINGRKRTRIFQSLVAYAERTLRSADLINVSNTDDRDELIRCGHPSSKIIVLPFGITTAQYQRFQASSLTKPSQPVITFVGTFDQRKGSVEFPEIVRDICTQIPDARFKIIGSRYKDADAVLRSFPSSLRDRLEIIPVYEPEELPGYLASCSIGIFPSYLEGFGIGVLEMLAAGLPVVAYRVPGPPMMLTEELMVASGDFHSLARRVVEILRSPATLKASQNWARQRASEFLWPNIAESTLRLYSERLAQRANSAAANPA